MEEKKSRCRMQLFIIFTVMQCLLSLISLVHFLAEGTDSSILNSIFVTSASDHKDIYLRYISSSQIGNLFFLFYIFFKPASEHISRTEFNAWLISECITAGMCFMDLKETTELESSFWSYCCKINLSAIENFSVPEYGLVKA